MEEKEYDYDCYEVKLNPMMNVQPDLLWIVLAFAGCALVAAVDVFVYQKDMGAFAFYACFWALIVAVKLTSHPKRLEITRTTVKFKRRTALLTLLTRGRISYGIDEGIEKYTEAYTVYNISVMEYLQTPFEKIFSSGHIRIVGDVNVRGEKETREFHLYGVKHFADISAWMKDYMRIAESDTEKTE